MKRTILAAVDATAACTPVLAHARALARAFGGDLHAVHVSDGDDTHAVRELARHAGVQVSIIVGDPIETISRLAKDPDVEALVLGASGLRDQREPGHIARAVATQSAALTLVVPPWATMTPAFCRILVPLEGSTATTAAVAAVLGLFAEHQQPELFMLHVFEKNDMPPFANHEPHEVDAWVHEFRLAYAPANSVRGPILMRVGRSDRLVTKVADEVKADLVVLAWSQNLSRGRARVVKAALDHHPTLLVPIDYAITRAPDDRPIVIVR